MTGRAHEGSRGQRRAGSGNALVQPCAEAFTASGADIGVCRGQTPRCAPQTAVGVQWGKEGASGKQTLPSHYTVIYLFICGADPVSLSAGKRTWAGGPRSRPQERAHPEHRGAAVGRA